MDRNVRQLQTQHGATITLRKEIAQGGEGSIYECVGAPRTVVKVYHEQYRTPVREAKIHSMLESPPHDLLLEDRGEVSIAWPQQLLYKAGQFVGFTMGKVEKKKPIFHAYRPTDRVNAFPEFTYQSLVMTARNLSAVIALVHLAGHVVGDVNESNILVGADGLVALVDTDSFQIADVAQLELYLCEVGKEYYTPPELVGKPFYSVARSMDADNWGVAVLLYQLLMEGFHPFDGRSFKDDEKVIDRVVRGAFPHRLMDLSVVPNPHAPPFSMLAPSLQRAFRKTFVDGHKKPHKRVNAFDWKLLLEQELITLVQCKQNPRHWFWPHYPCPWCKRAKQLGGRDVFGES